MRITQVAAAIGVAALLSSIALASQPEVKLDQLAPLDRVGHRVVLDVLLPDPYAASDMRIELPSGYATLDVDADPFQTASR